MKNTYTFVYHFREHKGAKTKVLGYNLKILDTFSFIVIAAISIQNAV